MSHKIVPHKEDCHCIPSDLPSRLEIEIAKYRKLAQEAERERDMYIQKALSLEGLAHETNATENKNEILAALPEEASEEDIDSLF